jgi:hypothetical protein
MKVVRNMEQQLTTDAATDLTQTVTHYLKASLPVRDALRLCLTKEYAEEMLEQITWGLMPFGFRTEMSKALVETAMKHIDWDAVVRALVTYFGLTMPWTEKL